MAANWDYFNGCGFVKCSNATDAQGSDLIVGFVPGGLPPFSGAFNWTFLSDSGAMTTVLTTSISCALIGFVRLSSYTALLTPHKPDVSCSSLHY